MSYKEIYKTSYSKIVRESVLKSIVYGVMIGLGAAIVVALSTMFVDFNGIWLALGICVAVSVALSLVFYYVKYRPTEKYVAERLDRMGFDERFITMLELRGDESYIAKKQKENTVEVVTEAAKNNNGDISSRTTAEKLAAVGLTTRNMIIAAVVFVVAVISLTFTALPNKRVREIFNVVPEYNIEFSAGENGFVTSSANGYARDPNALNGISQVVKEGSSSATIVVTANNGYVFAGWDDMDPNGKIDPSRNVDGVYSAIKATANYEEMVEPEDEEFGGGDGGPGEPGDGNGNAPPSDSQSGQNNKPGELGPPSNGASSSPSDSNGQILDGNTDYHEVFAQYYEEIQRMLAEGKELPPILRQIYESYFNGLE